MNTFCFGQASNYRYFFSPSLT